MNGIDAKALEGLQYRPSTLELNDHNLENDWEKFGFDSLSEVFETNRLCTGFNGPGGGGVIRKTR